MYKYQLDKSLIYTTFITYYDNISLSKVNDDDKFSVYAAMKSSLIQNEYDYIIVIVDRDVFPIDHLCKLVDLQWVEFHTRKFSSKLLNCVIEKYKPKHYPFYSITLVEKIDKQSIYNVDNLPLKIILDENPKNIYDYPPKSGLVNALETFHARVVFKSDN